jgi:hypothetical protein
MLPVTVVVCGYRPVIIEERDAEHCGVEQKA